jgi:hypothetical protein
MADLDDQIRSAMDDAIAAGGREEMYKGLTRKAAEFRGFGEAEEKEAGYKEQRRKAAAQRRISFKAATDRSAERAATRR